MDIPHHIRRAGIRAFRIASGKELIMSAYADGKPRRYIIADLHFGHGNIIKYCNRPFLRGDSEEMDRVLIQNWNLVVRPEDTVYVVGDFVFGRRTRPWWEYDDILHGQKVYFHGNHDRFDNMLALDQLDLMVGGEKFLLIHDPTQVPEDYQGWIIHGHVHNNHPFISFRTRRVNISADVIGYRPVDLELVADVIHRGVLVGERNKVIEVRP